MKLVKKHVLVYLCMLPLLSSPQTYHFWGSVSIMEDGKYIKPTPQEIKQIKNIEKLIQNHSNTGLNALPLDQEQQRCKNLILLKKEITRNVKLYLRGEYNIDALSWFDSIIQDSQHTIIGRTHLLSQQTKLFTDFWKKRQDPFKDPVYQKAFKEACIDHTESLQQDTQGSDQPFLNDEDLRSLATTISDLSERLMPSLHKND